MKKYLLYLLFLFSQFLVLADSPFVFEFNGEQINNLHENKLTIEGDKLKLEYSPFDKYMQQEIYCPLPDAAPGNWTDFANIEFKIHNPMVTEQKIGFKPDATRAHNVYFNIQPGQTKKVSVPLFHLKRYADMTQVKGLIFKHIPKVEKLSAPVVFLIDSIVLKEKTILDENALDINVLKPHYRNSIYSSNPLNEIEISIKTNMKQNFLSYYYGELTFYADDKKLKTKKIDNIAEETVYSCNIDTFSENYKIELKLYEKSNDHLVKTLHKQIRRLPKNENEVIIDKNNNLLVNGEKFLPIGIYFTSPATDMKYIKENGFNCIAPYHPPSKEFLDNARKYDLMMMPNFCLDRKEGIVLKPQNFDAETRDVVDSEPFLGYYLYDEPEPVNIQPPQIKSIISLYTNYDPYHPTYICYHKEYSYYGFEYAADISMVDVYGLPGSFEPLLSKMNEAKEAVDSQTPIWYVGQLFSYWSYNSEPLFKRNFETGRPLRYNEMRSHTWMAILLGAKGILYYNYHTTNPDVIQRIAYPKTWKALGYIVAELKALKDVILSDNQPQNLEVSCESELVIAQSRQVGGNHYIIVVNGKQEPLQARVATKDISGQLYELGNYNMPVMQSNSLYVNMAPQTTKIYTTDSQMANDFLANLPVEKYRFELENADNKDEIQGKKNVARIDNNAKLSASWGFPEANQKDEYGTCRATTWKLMIDGNRSTKWLMGHDGGWATRYIWPDEVIYQGQRWIEVKFDKVASLKKIIVTITPDANYELQYYENGNWYKLAKTEYFNTDKYHYELTADVDTYKANSVLTDKIRLYFNNKDDSKKPPTIFEIEAIEN